MDRVKNAYRIEYSVGGSKVVASTTFYMNQGQRVKSMEGFQRLRTGTGKMSPEQVKNATQAIIDSRRSEVWTPEKIRSVQMEYGIGIDCSGLARRMLREILGRQPKGFRSDPGMMGSLNVDNEVRGGVKPGWQKVGVEQARSGDILLLAHYTESGKYLSGHKTMVYSHNVINKGGDKVHEIVVYASFGRDYAGPSAMTWYYSEKNQTWSDRVGGSQSQSPPYGSHYEMAGVFRETPSWDAKK